MVHKWYPSRLLRSHGPDVPYAMVILNQPLNVNAIDAIIDDAVLLVCADAGGDRFRNYEENAKTQVRLPDAIVGDLDSLTAEAGQHYRQKGVRIVEDPDQYSTDFTKCLRWIRREYTSTHPKDSQLDVVVLGGLGGRVDQGFSQIHHLYMARQAQDMLLGHIYLLSEQSLSFVLEQGLNEIHIEPETFEANIGIIPVAGPLHISTTGLEWDVEDWPTEFGGQVSTSNHIRSDLITIFVRGKDPLFTLELAKRFCLN